MLISQDYFSLVVPHSWRTSLDWLIRRQVTARRHELKVLNERGAEEEEIAFGENLSNAPMLAQSEWEKLVGNSELAVVIEKILRIEFEWALENVGIGVGGIEDGDEHGVFRNVIAAELSVFHRTMSDAHGEFRERPQRLVNDGFAEGQTESEKGLDWQLVKMVRLTLVDPRALAVDPSRRLSRFPRRLSFGCSDCGRC
jgi:hypothetical protein